MISAAWPAPAKLNLFLHITGRREDGLHALQTLFQLVDCCDYLDFRVRRDGQIRRYPSAEGLPSPERDLSVRAASLLREVSACRLGVEIRIHKRLPVGGGLGGGSSNAATTLAALNRLWGLEASAPELAAVALALGADVPIFLHGQTAWAEGVGEQFSPCPADPRWFLIIDPAVEVRSAQIYATPDLTRNTPPITMDSFSAQSTRNDCQETTCKLYPEVKVALEWLSAHAPARMTGSGGCVFAAFDSREQAEEIARALPARWRSLIGPGLSRSPLVARLEAEGQKIPGASPANAPGNASRGNAPRGNTIGVWPSG